MHEDLLPGRWQPQVVLMAALKTGLIGALLETPRAPAAVAAELGLDERATVRVTAALVDAGYLERRGDRAVVTAELRPLLDPASPDYAGARLLHLHGLLARWVQLPQVLHEGGPAPSEYTPETLDAFIGAMRLAARDRARPLASLLAALFPATRSALDVGGGPGTQAFAFREQGWQVTVLDFPEVIDLMAGELAQGSIATIKGDATEGIPTRDVDLVFCGNLFHSMPPADCEAVVGHAAGALRPGGALAIYDFLRGEGLTSSLFAVNMLVATSAGDVYGEEDYRRWCEAAGLQNVAVHEVPGQAQRLLTAVKP